MQTLAFEVNHNTASTRSSNFYNINKKNQQLQSTSQFYLLKAVIESFVDGILVLTPQRELVHANERARSLCHQLMENANSDNLVPEEIWLVCQSLLEANVRFSDEKFFSESEIHKNQAINIRIRARWLQLEQKEAKYLLVTLEDANQSSQSMALADAKKFGLTEREAEVWLLRRANLSYKEIADKLYITINTVKKHLKNIYAKQQERMCF
jgi:RNA polymerase sigma factor (sigma-70 family)